MSKAHKRPGNAMIVTTYAELSGFVSAFAKGHFNLLIVIGAPGLQKSRIVREAVGQDACMIEGVATPFIIYCKLWEHRDQSIVLDDVDALCADRNGVRLLKSLCQTEHRKTVAWHSDAKTLDYRGIPREFKTTSRVVIVANDWKTFNENVAAVEDRGQVIFFMPTPLEVHLRTAEWFWDQDIFDFVGERLHLIETPSMRTYVLAWQLKQAGIRDWRRWLLSRWLSDTALVAAELRADPSYPDERAREQAFIAKTGRSRATYYNHVRKLQPPVEPPKLKLKNQPPREGSPAFDLLQLLKSRQRGFLGRG